MQKVLNFFLSIKTAFGFFLFFVAVCLHGSLSLPNNLAFFSGIDDTPLFRWLAEARGAGTTWWIWVFITALAVFALNTIACTADAVLHRIGRHALIVKLSPQVMHIGVLFVMLGHLLTASYGIKLDIDLAKGEVKSVAGTASMLLEDVAVTEDENGYAVDWEAQLRWIDGKERSALMGLRPAHPLYVAGYGLYSKSVVKDDAGSSALVRVSRDPGALWALLGGVLLSIGGLGFVYGRFRSAYASSQR
jgi:hypothetical protein